MIKFPKQMPFTVDGRRLLAKETDRGWLHQAFDPGWDIYEWVPIPDQLLENYEGEGVTVQDPDAKQLRLLTVADPWTHPPTQEELVSFLSVRKQRLVQLMNEKSIIAGDDYQYEDDYELLENATRQPGRYVAVYGDETYNGISLADTIEAALGALSGLEMEEYRNVPEGIYDLDEDRWHPIATVTVLRDEPAPPAEPQQAGTHRERVTIVWNEVVSYNQVIEIDVPDGYAGNLGDLIDANDEPEFDHEDDLAEVPEGFKTHWLERADFSSTVAVDSRDITDVRKES